ncbi:N-(5'-phosphoribosyl)anthranilate isomerase [Novimethylophilus kurashikiensis]|uniref:N-(5'-phosphoribosyl)anthranilate isomerase n=1 Tax=Novimethylophilus kurashikiensis TaxID=1825523 RepID=A0A2R5FCV7_9PROT|nr:BtpA/SgcQ family protein [Novimethylophilus kurashikiensis]GBG14541.1 N-(5'-phosphoribosyl)anthranilate isomerase [Novimethylophilus kurashikiensis]
MIEQKRWVYPVIHHLDDVTTIHQACVAKACGADGVFLISHNGEDSDLPPLAYQLKCMISSSPREFKVGINLLSKDAYTAYRYARKHLIDMVWVDAPGVSSEGGYAEEARRMADIIDGSIDFFGSVAFKYQPHEPNPDIVAVMARDLGMLPTTSGTATGSAPDIAKARLMSKALEGGPLAVASGMSVDNVDAYLPYFTHYLVATGVSLDENHFDPEKLKAFVRKVHEY